MIIDVGFTASSNNDGIETVVAAQVHGMSFKHLYISYIK